MIGDNATLDSLGLTLMAPTDHLLNCLRILYTHPMYGKDAVTVAGQLTLEMQANLISKEIIVRENELRDRLDSAHVMLGNESRYSIK